MNFFLYLTVTSFCGIVYGECPWEDHKVIPEVIPKLPGKLLKVSYGEGLHVLEGNELTPTQVKAAPKVTWEAEKNSYYTLIMTDPDVPSRFDPTFREWRHWLVGNIPGNDLNKGETLASYMAIGPPEGSGIHRYVFLLYKQPGLIKFQEPILGNSCKDRPLFSTVGFVEKYSLGEPAEGSFYTGQYDEYSLVVQKDIGIQITKAGNETKVECIKN